MQRCPVQTGPLHLNHACDATSKVINDPFGGSPGRAGLPGRLPDPARPMNRQALAHADAVRSFYPLGEFEEGISIYGAEGRSLFAFQDVTSGADPRDCREPPAQGLLRCKATTAISRRPDSWLRGIIRARRHSRPAARGPRDRSALTLSDKPGCPQRLWP